MKQRVVQIFFSPVQLPLGEKHIQGLTKLTVEVNVKNEF